MSYSQLGRKRGLSGNKQGELAERVYIYIYITYRTRTFTRSYMTSNGEVTDETKQVKQRHQMTIKQDYCQRLVALMLRGARLGSRYIDQFRD